MTTEESLITDDLRNAVGVESEAATYEVEKGAIIRFAEAIGDSSPLFQEEVEARRSRYGGIIAPPTFFRTMRPGPARAEVSSPLSRNLDGGSEWDFFEPVHPGDRITVTNLLKEVVQRSGRLGQMIIMTRETKYVNQLGQVVALQRSTGISY
ncbi:MAG: MaoC family dehydratase N-terminal domain-containing protein [Chloroflexi bacterium]|nr:MaoC family dehydratase N-terminal domain-containing protein [Chloroflexota bacterium]